MRSRNKKHIKKGTMMAAAMLTALIGVFGLNVDHALSPTAPPRQISAVLSATASAEKADTENPVATAKPAPAATPETTVAPLSPPAPPPASPYRAWGLKDLYVNPSSGAASQAGAWAGSRPADAALMSRMAAQQQAEWYGDWNPNVQADVNGYVSQAAAASKMPLLVAYNIPGRDCGSYSAGGAASADAYAAWMQAFARGIAGRPAVVILEPDALAMLTTCLTPAQQQDRLQMLKTAVATLKASTSTYVYIDAGNPGFQPASVMGPRLVQAGVGQADGFSLNVSNFYVTNDLVAYGTAVSALASNKHFVLDTSRNGNGAAAGNAWCNPDGRALGAVPTASPGLGSLVDALLWIKRPGESDGSCNGGPSAGNWWPDYALGLAQRAGW